MSANELRQAAEAERREWGGEQNARQYPTSSAIHLALADWLDFVAAGRESLDMVVARFPDGGAESDLFRDTEEHALTVARLINEATA